VKAQAREAALVESELAEALASPWLANWNSLSPAEKQLAAKKLEAVLDRFADFEQKWLRIGALVNLRWLNFRRGPRRNGRGRTVRVRRAPPAKASGDPDPEPPAPTAGRTKATLQTLAGNESDGGALGESRTTKTTKDLTNAGYSRGRGGASALALAAMVAFFPAPFGAPHFQAFVRPAKNLRDRRRGRRPERGAQRGAPQRSGWPKAILDAAKASVSVPLRGGPGGAS